MLEETGVEATSLASSPSQLLDDLVRPYCVGLADWKTLAMCKPAWRNHAQLWGGSVAEIFMSTLAYGWVERSTQLVARQALYEISIFVYFISAIIFDG